MAHLHADPLLQVLVSDGQISLQAVQHLDQTPEFSQVQLTASQLCRGQRSNGYIGREGRVRELLSRSLSRGRSRGDRRHEDGSGADGTETHVHVSLFKERILNDMRDSTTAVLSNFHTEK